MPNPFVECDTMQKAYNLAGFTMTAPEKIDSVYNSRIIRAINGNFIEVIYPNAKDTGDEVRLRKGFALDDVSGDYHSYPVNKKLSVGGKSVLLRGEANNFHVASWTVGKYSYAVTARKGLPEKQIIELTGNLQ